MIGLHKAIHSLLLINMLIDKVTAERGLFPGMAAGIQDGNIGLAPNCCAFSAALSMAEKACACLISIGIRVCFTARGVYHKLLRMG
jgi:hypothetical protein